MVQGGEQLRLAFEPRQTLGIARNGGRQHFDSDVAMQTRIARPIHLTHPADAEDFRHLVHADTERVLERDALRPCFVQLAQRFASGVGGQHRFEPRGKFGIYQRKCRDLTGLF
jgi:hypothetical protein